MCDLMTDLLKQPAIETGSALAEWALNGRVLLLTSMLRGRRVHAGRHAVQCTSAVHTTAATSCCALYCLACQLIHSAVPALRHLFGARSRDEVPLGNVSFDFDSCEAISGRCRPNNHNGHAARAGEAAHSAAPINSSGGNGNDKGSAGGDAAELAALELGIDNGASAQGLFFTPVGAKVRAALCMLRCSFAHLSCWALRNSCCGAVLLLVIEGQLCLPARPSCLQFWKAKHELLICGCAVRCAVPCCATLSPCTALPSQPFPCMHLPMHPLVHAPAHPCRVMQGNVPC